MYSNNTKVASFYPSSKKPLNNFLNSNLKTIDNQNIINKGYSINNNNNQISDSFELALITVNLSLPRFKSMNREEIDNYIKTMAYNNSFDSKKYMLSLNILLNEHDKLQQEHFTKQVIHIEETKPKSTSEQRVSMYNYDARQMAYIEPDEFKLNMSQSQSQSQSKPIQIYDPFSTTNNIKNDDSSNVSIPFSIKQNKNLEMTTYNGNPHGVVKIINSHAGNSLRPLNSMTRSNDNSTIKSSTVYNTTDMSDISYNDNFTNRSNQNNVVKQTSFMQNPTSVMANGGKRRTSNLDVGTSNNYVIINN
jgi:hypothetical protein